MRPRCCFLYLTFFGMSMMTFPYLIDPGAVARVALRAAVLLDRFNAAAPGDASRRLPCLTPEPWRRWSGSCCGRPYSASGLTPLLRTTHFHRPPRFIRTDRTNPYSPLFG